MMRTNSLLSSYYEKPKTRILETERRKRIKVSVRIVKVLSETGFSFTPKMSISRFAKNYLLESTDTPERSGIITSQKEWVLDGETVLYGNASELRDTLEYDFSKKEHSAIKGCRSMK